MRLTCAFIFLLSSVTFGQKPVFDATLYQNKPPSLPMKPITLIYTAYMWPGTANRDNLPDAATIATLAKKAESTGIAVIDVEHWPEDSTGYVKYESLLEQFKRDDPKVKFGYYAIAPKRDYWRSIQGEGTSAYTAWQEENKATDTLGHTSDIVFPSLYTFYEDRAGWKKYAIAQIKEARRYGKPVYVFLWPEYHTSNKNLHDTYLPADYWRMELETVGQYADGIVIWGGYNQKWDDGAPWWLETLAYMQGK